MMKSNLKPKQKREDIVRDVFREQRLKSRKRHFFVLLTFLILGVGFVYPYIANKNIDENQFCLDKLNTEFAEYEFTDVDYTTSDGNDEDYYLNPLFPVCEGYYINLSIEKRDGLELIKQSQYNKLTFKLIDKKDIKYLESDYWYGLLSILGLFMFAGAFITLISWSEAGW